MNEINEIIQTIVLIFIAVMISIYPLIWNKK